MKSPKSPRTPKFEKEKKKSQEIKEFLLIQLDNLETKIELTLANKIEKTEDILFNSYKILENIFNDPFV